MWVALFMIINTNYTNADIEYSINKNCLRIYIFALPKKLEQEF